MKLTSIILLTFLLHVSAATKAQQVTLKADKISLRELFKQVRKQTGYDILFQSGTVNTNATIKADFNQTPLQQVMEQSLQAQNLDFVIDENTVIIKQKKTEPQPTPTNTQQAQPVTITGKVTDETGQPLPGVTVKQKGTNNGTVTDAKGVYSITVQDNNALITFSYVGYEIQEFAAKDIPNGAVITLKAIATNLKEVVVNKGYYNERRELSTGDVSVVTSKEISEQPVSDPIQALIGRVPGLNIQQSSGVPGANSTVRIRGLNSISNGNEPLYIVDGVPFSSNSLTSPDIGGGVVGGPGSPGVNYKAGGLSPFNNLNPSDIESIEVLKDADATAIYGSRGANGVILITTKQGKPGDTKVNLDFNQGAGQVTRKLDLLNTQQYLQMRHQAFINDGKTPGARDFDVNGTWDTTRYTNWQKVLIGNVSQYTNLQGSVSGGNANTQFLIGGGYNRQGTVFPGDYSDKKGSMHLNLTHSSSNQKFHIQFTTSFVNDNSNLPQTDLTNKIVLAPDAPTLYDANGNLNFQPVNGTGTFNNPLAYTRAKATANTDNLISNMNLSYQVLDGLIIKSSFGYSHEQMNQNLITPATYFAPPNDNNADNRSNLFATTDYKTWIIEPQISYQRRISKGQFSALLGTTFQEDKQNSLAQNASGFASDALIADPQAATSLVLYGDESSLYHYNAVFGRLSYNWDEKYLINLTARRDGSSRFGPGKQFGNFGAAGLGWIFTKEKFVSDNLEFLSFGKLRLSYGTTGNDQLGDYKYLSTYNPASTTYQGLNGLSPSQITNPYFGWEVVKKLEGGIDLGFFKDRLQISVNYYRNRTSDQLVGYTLPSVTGFTTIEANLPAVIQNSGTEISLISTNIRNSDFVWTTAFNLTVPTNKLVSYPDIDNSSYQNVYAVGQSLYIKYLYHYTGVNSQTGLYTFATSNASGIPSYPNDLVITKPITQQFYGGFQNSVRYKGFQLDFLFQFVKQTGFNYSSAFIYPGFFSNGLSNQPTYVLNRWQNPGDVVSIERATQTGGPALTAAATARNSSDYPIADASFIRLKNLAFSYKVPASWQNWAHLQNTRIYLQGQNLLTITRYKGLDPETQGLVLPPLRMITLGLQTSL